MVAEAVATAPWNITKGPFFAIFAMRMPTPALPSTYRMVLHVSTGVSMIRKRPAVTEPPIDFTGVGSERVISLVSQRLRNRVFENVSPNLDRGPWIRATLTPTQYT